MLITVLCCGIDTTTGLGQKTLRVVWGARWVVMALHRPERHAHYYYYYWRRKDQYCVCSGWFSPRSYPNRPLVWPLTIAAANTLWHPPPSNFFLARRIPHHFSGRFFLSLTRHFPQRSNDPSKCQLPAVVRRGETTGACTLWALLSSFEYSSAVSVLQSLWAKTDHLIQRCLFIIDCIHR